MPTAPDVRISSSPADLFRAAADYVAAQARKAVSAGGRFNIALSGGSTPRGLFSLLATRDYASLPWAQTYCFWGDERHVPPDDKDSNYRMARETLLSRVPIPPENIHRVRAEEQDPEKCARSYADTVRRSFGLRDGEFPRFDLVLLGMGPDGHTASLFPDTKALGEQQRCFVENWVPKFDTWRFTLTYPTINNAAAVAFLVAGSDKAAPLKEVLRDPNSTLPSSRIKPTNGELVWFCDKAAAGALGG